MDCHRGRVATQDAGSHPGAHGEADPTRAGRDSLTHVCGRCHEEVLRLFSDSPFGERNHPPAQTPTCVTCHSSTGSELLTVQEIAQRCAECHRQGSQVGYPEIPARAAKLLDALHRLTLTRVLLLQAVLEREAAGVDMTNVKQQIDAVDCFVGDPVLEWHRFDLVRVDVNTKRTMRRLEAAREGLDGH